MFPKFASTSILTAEESLLKDHPELPLNVVVKQSEQLRESVEVKYCQIQLKQTG